MIIRDLEGGTLNLSKKKLTEKSESVGKYYLNLVELEEDSAVILHQVERKTYDSNLLHSVSVQVGFRSHGVYGNSDWMIGCRIFSKKVFKQIMQAAKVARREQAKAERKSGKSK